MHSQNKNTKFWGILLCLFLCSSAFQFCADTFFFKSMTAFEIEIWIRELRETRSDKEVEKVFILWVVRWKGIKQCAMPPSPYLFISSVFFPFFLLRLVIFFIYFFWGIEMRYASKFNLKIYFTNDKNYIVGFFFDFFLSKRGDFLLKLSYFIIFINFNSY